MKRLLILIALFLLSACTLNTPLPVTPPASLTPQPTLTPIGTPSATPAAELRFPQRNRLSYNINGIGRVNEARLIAHIKALNPTTLLVMDDLVWADRLWRELNAVNRDNTIVIHRRYSSMEGGEWSAKTASKIVNDWLAEGFKHIVRYSVNEPSFAPNAGEFSRLITHEREVMRLAREAGITVCMSNFGIGTIQPQWVAAGLLDDYLRDLDTYDHYLCAHEYTTGVLPFGVGLWYRWWLTDRERVQIDDWPLDLPTAYWPFPAQSAEDEPFGFEMLRRHYEIIGDVQAQAAVETYPPYWHLRRADWLLLRADEIGVPRPRIILTEAFWDSLPDIGEVVNELKATYGFRDYNYNADIRGINTYHDDRPNDSHTSLWEYYWPYWTHAEAAMCQLLWVELIYPPDYIGFDMYTINTNIQWRGFTMQNVNNEESYLDEFWALMEGRVTGAEDIWRDVCWAKAT